MFDTNETIAAISTAAGSAARAIVRLSGTEALATAGKIFKPESKPFNEVGGFRCVDGRVKIRAEGIELPARAYIFRAPRSYTRQDVVELHLPGASAAASALQDALISAGARQARPGEFTAKAFFAGRIDLSEAEAVADVINVADRGLLQAAVGSLRGRIHAICRRASARITEVLAEVEASIDLGEEDIALTPPANLAGTLMEVASVLHQTADTASDMPETGEYPQVVLAGEANVGKSSLLNALTGTERAITSALAGTTRDVLSAAMKLPIGGVVMLNDAAGLVRGDEDDFIVAAADNAALRAVERAEVIIFVFDLAGEDFRQGQELLWEVITLNPGAALIVAGNKTDLAGSEPLKQLGQMLQCECLSVSAATGEGLDSLKWAISENVHISAARGSGAMGLHRRQKRCITAAAEALRRAAGLLQNAAETADVAELAAVELRAALAEIGQISGQVVTEDVLGQIFSRFCVGK